uniref:Uncharacterized protein n=1 Tax=Sphaerodactylus townsendi TaxID=933632 RepID=A0ACB8ENP2_9SAUR
MMQWSLVQGNPGIIMGWICLAGDAGGHLQSVKHSNRWQGIPGHLGHAGNPVKEEVRGAGARHGSPRHAPLRELGSFSMELVRSLRPSSSRHLEGQESCHKMANIPILKKKRMTQETAGRSV